MSLSTETKVIIAGGAVVLIAAWYASKKLGDAAGAVYDGVATAVGDAYDWTAETVKETVPYVNPADSRNVVYGSIGAVGGAISGDKNWSLGGWIYDITH
jgi:hypothetical protein